MTFAPNEPCNHAISIEALFEVPDLDYALQQHVDIKQLQLSQYALMLIIRGDFPLSWMTPAVARAQLDGLIGYRREQSDREEIEALMRPYRKGARD